MNSGVAQDETLVRIENLSVSRSGKTILRVPKLVLHAGDRIGVVGENGSGKSTLLRVLAGLESGTAGDCSLDITSRERVLVHQAPWLFRGSVLTNVGYGLAARGVSRSERRERSEEWLRRLGISALTSRPVRNLSGGEARRVAIARACVLEPRLLLLDEPFADLDQAGCDAVVLAIETLTDSAVLVASPRALPAGIVERTVSLSTE